MLLQSDIETLRKCFLFEEMVENEFVTLSNHCEVVQFKKGDIIFGNDCFQKFGILLNGTAVALCAGGDKSALKSFSVGDVFGAATIFCNERVASFSKIKASSSGRVLYLNRAYIEALISVEPKTAIKYIEFLSNRVEFLNRRISTFTADQSVSRLAKYILDNAKNGVCEDVGFASVARELDISRATFYRAKKSLEESGAATLDAKKITVLNADILKRFI